MGRITSAMPRLAVVLLLLLPSTAAAHPGVGIVRTKSGLVYFTDLAQVWRIAADGTKSVAVPRVHTHELWLDPDENLLGEHLWYEGDATKKWGHRVWKLAPDGTLTDVVKAREGFRTEFSFVRDAAGTCYFSEVERRDRLFRKRPGEPARLLASGFSDLRWMTAAPDGTVYVVDLRDVVRVAPNGGVRRLATNLSRKRWLHEERHLVMGIWLDGGENVYVAAAGERAVKKISPTGAVSIVATSSFPWSPTGGLVTPEGDLFVLEYSATNAVRVRRIARNGKVTVY